MKLRPTLLLCGAVLIAAVPLLADSIPYPGSVKASPGVENFARETRSSVVRMNGPVFGAVRAEPTPAVLPIDTFNESHAFDVLNSKSLITRNPIFPSSSDLAIRSASLNSLHSFEHGPSFLHDGKAWDKARKEKKDKGDNDNGNIGTIGTEPITPLVTNAIPEPGSLSLLLIGLTTLGFSVRRRKNFSLTI